MGVYNKNMKGFKQNIESMTLQNSSFRKVVYTGKNTQLVLMSLAPNEEIGYETHDTVDQFFRFEKGCGKVFIDENEYDVKDGDAVIIPSGARHNVVNTSQTDTLKLYTLYSPPEHQDGIERVTKADAESHEEHFDGTTTE